MERLAIEQELGNPDGIASSLESLGRAALWLGDYTQATACYEESLALFQNLKNQRGSTFVIEGYAELALAHELPKRAARLCGAVEAQCDAISSVHEFPEERVRHKGIVAASRAQLDDATFAAAWAQEQAIAEALGEGG
jgi:tetratricopeptide (TPR) repeat protein